MEITSKRLNLLYRLEDDEGVKYKLKDPSEVIGLIRFANRANIEQLFTDWAHNDIAFELQGIIDDDDVILEIRIWYRND